MYIFRQGNEFQGISGRKYLAESSKYGQKASSDNLIWEPARNTNPRAPPKTYWITNSEGWRPAKASESLSEGGTYNSASQMSDKERPRDHRCVAYLKHLLKHVWRPKSKASSSMKHSLMHSWKWNYISSILLLLKLPRGGERLRFLFIVFFPAVSSMPRSNRSV